MSSTLKDYLVSQDSLVSQASLALPHSFSTCTYSLGYIRQAVYLCITCGLQRGICSGVNKSILPPHPLTSHVPSPLPQRVR
jgi:E3 ubiquitin-protein ligase UBR7